VRACYLAAADAYLRYFDFPGREPVRVYLPGLGGSGAAAFAHVAAHPVLAGHRSLLVDFLGFGLSDKPRSFGYTLDDHAETVVTLLDQLGLRMCEMIGHSSGGAIAVLIAARRPDLVAALVMADGNLDPGGGAFSASIAAQSESTYVGRGYQAQIASLRDRARAVDSSEGPAELVGMLQVAAPDAVHRTARSLVEMPRPTVREQLVQVTMPRSFLVGARTLEAETPSGAIADWTYVQGLSDAGVRLLVVPDAGHGMMSDNPDGFVRTLVQALRSADR
jgi:pimeloyl-ACP methyl ester carboxylesterase